MPQSPFSIFKRKRRHFYYVQFKSKKGGYLPAVSAKQLTEAAAIETAFLWLRESKPSSIKGKAPYKGNSNALPLISSSSASQPATQQKINIILRDILRDITNKFIDFLDNFRDFDSSPYRDYTIDQKNIVKKYWEPYFKLIMIGNYL